jgi:hypothetical protein
MRVRPFLFTLFVPLFFLVVMTTLFQAVAAGVDERGGTAVTAAASTHPEYGVNFISWARPAPVSETRYQNALSTGAGWNRWPLYWSDIEQSSQTPGDFHWAYQDTTVIADIEHGLKIDAVLLGTPSFYTTNPAADQLASPLFTRPTGPLSLDAVQAATPVGLYEPVFTDSSDIPGTGKTINDGNKWARFVYAAVSRYKPGGIIAQQRGWPAGVGVTHWELWNEPDLAHFWDGTIEDYARLLKVGYLAAKQADANAQVLFGGLANASQNAEYYRAVMNVFSGDANAPTYSYYHDIFATHNYHYAKMSWQYVFRASQVMADFGFDKPIWLNESGVPVWDDYPGPVCEPDSPYRATMSEQADFIVQSALYATYGGADMLFFFQLYDDCGNIGGNHDWYSTDICSDEVIEPGGDAFGLFRNPNEAGYCYTNHPQPETPRPGYDAYRMLTTYFTDVEPIWWIRPYGSTPNNGRQEWLAFFKPATGERVLGMFTRYGTPETAVITSTDAAGTGLLITPDGVVQTVQATNGFFTFNLPAATNQNNLDPNDTTIKIGGRPYLLIEPDTLPPNVTAGGPVTAVSGINLTWAGTDLGSGMQNYDVTVAVDGGTAVPWLTGTTATSATYNGAPGHTYTFRVYGRDNGGNVSGGTAVHVTTKELNERVYLPLAFKN